MSDTIQFAISMGNDEDGFFGRECPQEDCLGYFKIELGTGLEGDDLPCHCPYCGHVDPHDQFWTQDQLEYAKSLAMRKVQDYVFDEIKRAFPSQVGRSSDLFSLTFDVKPGSPLPLHHYQEAQLQTTLVCDACGLRYAVYGVFAYCPDCGSHNSLQILESNLDLAVKELELASGLDAPLGERLVADALQNVVGAFDAFGRELLRVNASNARSSRSVGAVSCQNLENLRKKVQDYFAFDIAEPFNSEEWDSLVVLFQKRHLIAHKMGVIDGSYVAATRDPHAIVGRKVEISTEEVSTAVPRVRTLGRHLQATLAVSRKRTD